MPPHPEAKPVLFEATTTPPASLSARALRILALGVVACSAVVGGVCAWLGAWPILGFTGAEAALVLALLGLHRRWSRRMTESLRLADGRITIRRTDWRGRREEVVLSAYWTRLVLEERPGRVSVLLLRHRGVAVEVGNLLGEDQKRDLAEALAEALRVYRAPIFDNPQLRGPP
ncbi:MAG: DUF2244 domain-containing protein [Acetobacteraceae bacterium]|nr:DUF2244 domain-containing protein [Acetobacteraceae bacterium]